MGRFIAYWKLKGLTYKWLQSMLGFQTGSRLPSMNHLGQRAVTEKGKGDAQI